LYSVKCTEVQQMYQNSLEMMPDLLNTDLILSVSNVNVTSVTDVPKMTKNDPNLPVFGSVYFYMGFRKNPLLIP